LRPEGVLKYVLNQLFEDVNMIKACDKSNNSVKSISILYELLLNRNFFYGRYLIEIDTYSINYIVFRKSFFFYKI